MNLKYVFTNSFILKSKVLAGVIFCLVFWLSSINGKASKKHSPKKAGPQITPEYMKKALTEFRIYPYILPEIPEHPIEIFFGQKRVNFGNRLYWDVVKSDPTEVHWPVKKDKEYIILAIGPDGIGIYKIRCFFEHWLVGNIPGDDIIEGDTRTEYLGTVGHYYGIGYFRLIFLVYEQPEKNLTFTGEVVSIFNYGIIRECFNLKDFTEYFRLGPPHAVNFCVVYNNNTEKPDVL